MVAEALRRHGGRRKEAASELGIDASTLYRKIQALGIETPETDGRGSRAGKRAGGQAVPGKDAPERSSR